MRDGYNDVIIANETTETDKIKSRYILQFVQLKQKCKNVQR